MIIDKNFINRYFRGELSDKESEKLDSWIAESDENRKTYKQLRTEFLMLSESASQESVVTKPKVNVRRILWSVVASAAAIAGVFFLATWMVNDSVNQEINANRLYVEVPEGQRMDLTLPDGTRVNLNSGAEFSYPMAFRGKERKVSVEGEAKFSVTHDDKHPFVVETYAADVTVLGTEFVVAADEQENEFLTSLIEGKVKVDNKDKSQSWTLKPDQTIRKEAAGFIVRDGLDSQALYWSEGLVNISGIGFEELMHRLEKAYGVDIVIRRADIPRINCTSGEIRVSDGIEHALKVIGYVADFRYTRDHATGKVYID